MRETRRDISGFACFVYEKAISVFFAMILAALLYMAAVSTTFIDRYEMPYFLPDDPGKNVLIFFFILIFSILLYFFKNGHGDKRREFFELLERDVVFYHRTRAKILWAYWAVVSLWVVCTQVPTIADQRAVLLAAEYIAWGDYSTGGPVSYFYVYNNQVGITMIAYLLGQVFGGYNYVAYQLLNVVCITFLLKTLSELGELFGMERADALLLILLCGLFFPLALYASFIYGTMPSLLLSLLAVRFELLYFRNGDWRNAVLSAFCIGVAVLLKMNNLITMVAMLLYAAVRMLEQKSLKRVLYPLLIAAAFIAQNNLPTIAYERLSGEVIPEGMSTWGWVTMGLQDGERPGWWDGYSRYTFEASDYDAKKQEAWVKADLKARLEELWADKESARDFFVRKTASQWNEPSFQSVWMSISHWHQKYYQDVIGVDNDWPKLILTPTGNHAVTSYLNYLNFAILAGALLYIMLCAKSDGFHDSLILPMILIGGFLFHLVWEVKSQYAMPYFVLLLPYTVMGYTEAAGRIVRAGTALKNGESAFAIDRKALAVKLVLAVIAVLILWYVFHGTLGSITGDSEAYYAYLAAHN